MERTLPGLALAGGWLLLLLLGPFSLFFAVIILVASIGAMEYVKMCGCDGQGFLQRLLICGIFVLPVLAAGLWGGPGMHTGLFASFFLLSVYILYNFQFTPNSFEVFSRNALGLFYIGFLISHLVLIWKLPEGASWLVVLSSITAGSDSGAYYCGRVFGRTKLCPNISPKKTIEGVVGGVAAGVTLAVFFASILLTSVNWLFLVLAAVLLVGVGIVGDLTESVMKRGTGTKDSGSILAGHGGILDRMDSILFAGPFLYYLLVLAGGQ
ncbi:MAG: phosphatidate cytidylyltransferase [Desulfocapsaceae bacterium]|nr:phosphatidate cytidylyltransferase [Desulfocapsaceae bacterium]